MKKNYYRILSVLLISFSLIYNGCSMYGLGIGALIDARNPDYELVNRKDYETIEKFKNITVFQKDHTTKIGKFIEITGNNFILETKFGLEGVNMEDIANIEVASKKEAMWKGLGIGIALDLVYIVLLARSVAEEGN